MPRDNAQGNSKPNVEVHLANGLTLPINLIMVTQRCLVKLSSPTDALEIVYVECRGETTVKEDRICLDELDTFLEANMWLSSTASLNTNSNIRALKQCYERVDTDLTTRGSIYPSLLVVTPHMTPTHTRWT
jgi:hypothetical protein